MDAGVQASIECRVGGHVDVDVPLHMTGRILAWDPPRLFEHEFKLAPWKLVPMDEDGVLRYELEPDRDGCLFTMTFMRLTPKRRMTFRNLSSYRGPPLGRGVSRT